MVFRILIYYVKAEIWRARVVLGPETHPDPILGLRASTTQRLNEKRSLRILSFSFL